jgi:predicted Zn-dependent peptidase
LRQQRSQPFFLANERYNQAVFGSHPAARVSATAESVDKMTPADLAKWHKERFAPQNAILGIAGDVNAQEVIAKLRKWMAAWPKTDYREVLPPNPTPAQAKKIYLVNRPNSVQTNLLLGNIAVDRRSPDYVPMVVMNRIVGGGPAARLFINLREEKSYTYGAYSNFTALKYPGPWTANSEVRTEVTDGAMTEFLHEIRRIREEKVPAAELDEGKRSVVANFALSLESPQQLLSYATIRKIYGFPEDYWDTYPAKIMAVTAEEVQRVARKYINPDALQIVAVGDANKVKDVLEKYGPVELYDTDGKPVAAKAAAGSSSN